MITIIKLTPQNQNVVPIGKLKIENQKHCFYFYFHFELLAPKWLLSLASASYLETEKSFTSEMLFSPPNGFQNVFLLDSWHQIFDFSVFGVEKFW